MPGRHESSRRSWWALVAAFTIGRGQVETDVQSTFVVPRFEVDNENKLDTLRSDAALDEAQSVIAQGNSDEALTADDLAAFAERRGPSSIPIVDNRVAAKSVVQSFAAHGTRKQAPVSTAASAGRLTAATGGLICGEGGLCSGHGTCDTSTGKCVCNSGYGGEGCEVKRCVGFAESGVDCHGNGACQSGKCECADGWGMFKNRTGPQDCMDKICPFGCGDHGKCIDGYCVCFQGWTGQMCRDPACPGDCSGHGACMMQTLNGPGECTCDYGWAGAACHRPAVYAEQKPCPEDCAGNGLCMNGLCLCNVGFSGPGCAEKQCETGKTGPNCEFRACPRDCTGQGLCMDGECTCQDGFTGQDCSVPQQCLTSCRDACGGLEGGQESTTRCHFCVGQCLTNRNPFLGVHDPFGDMQSTLLQNGQIAGSVKKLRGGGGAAPE